MKNFRLSPKFIIIIFVILISAKYHYNIAANNGQTSNAQRDMMMRRFSFRERQIINKMKKITNELNKKVVKMWENAIASRELTFRQIFDRFYIPISLDVFKKKLGNKYNDSYETFPPQYHTQYDSYTDRHLPSIIEPILKRNPKIIFATIVDINGYLPTHNARYRQPLSGNLQKDLKTHRTKRIFADLIGLRASRNKKYIKIQDYIRDTGERFVDMSSPIYLRGKHWGATRIGFRIK